MKKEGGDITESCQKPGGTQNVNELSWCVSRLPLAEGCVSVMWVAMLDRTDARAQEAPELFQPYQSMAAMPEWDYP
jgi:hypothetical protein